MAEKWLVLQRYGEFPLADADCGVLAEAGMSARVNEEADVDSETGVTYTLCVPPESARKAYDLLSAHYENERYETFELMGDWSETA